MKLRSLAYTTAVVGTVATSASAIAPPSHPGLPNECQGACILKKIDDFLIVNPDWLPVRVPEPGEPSGPPDIVY